MTYGDLLTLLPKLMNRPAGGLTENVDLVRRAVKWAYAEALSNTDFECFSTFADVVVDTTAGVNWQQFIDTDAVEQFFSRIEYVSVLNTDEDEFQPVDFITRKHLRYRQLLRRPLRREAAQSPSNFRLPTAYIKAKKLHVTWFNDPNYPSSITLRIDGIVSLPNFLDTSVLNAAQLDARDWMLVNAENYLITKSMEFLQLYLKEDDRIAGMSALADRSFAGAVKLDSGIKDSNDEGYDLD